MNKVVFTLSDGTTMTSQCYKSYGNQVQFGVPEGISGDVSIRIEYYTSDYALISGEMPLHVAGLQNPGM
jgi:hypothetical protein